MTCNTQKIMNFFVTVELRSIWHLLKSNLNSGKCYLFLWSYLLQYFEC